jgi:hypothetical protein
VQITDELKDFLNIIVRPSISPDIQLKEYKKSFDALKIESEEQKKEIQYLQNMVRDKDCMLTALIEKIRRLEA